MSTYDPYDRMMETIAQHRLVEEGDALLLMVSGGSDSTALAHLAARLRDEGRLGALDMLHVNHKLRGADSEADARFVVGLAERLGIPLFACEIDIAAEAARSGENVEAVARRERYAAADEAVMSMCQHEAIPLTQGKIVTAHTIDDRIESFYMRSIVGTGPGGFRGMRYENGRVIRPLLDCSRAELREYLEGIADTAEGAPIDGDLWREDATNAHTDRFRAYVRHEIVPKAREWNPHLDATLGRTMNLIAQEDDMLQDMATDIIHDDVEPLVPGDCTGGFLLRPSFGCVLRPLQRRAVRELLHDMLGRDERIDASTIEAVLDAFDGNGRLVGGYVANVQGNLAISANKQGVRIEPMAAFRSRRKKR